MICHNPITGPNEASPVTPATPPRETWPWLQISDTLRVFQEILAICNSFNSILRFMIVL